MYSPAAGLACYSARSLIATHSLTVVAMQDIKVWCEMSSECSAMFDSAIVSIWELLMANSRV